VDVSAWTRGTGPLECVVMAKKPANNWPERIRLLMERDGLSQKDMASRLAMQQGSLSDILRGRRLPSTPVRLLIVLMENGIDLGKYFGKI